MHDSYHLVISVVILFQFLCNHLSHLLCHSFCPHLYCPHFYSAAALMFTIVVMPMHLARISTFPFISFTIHLFHH